MRLAVTDDRGATHYTMMAILSGHMPYCSEYTVPEFEIQEKFNNYPIPVELGYYTKLCSYSGSPLQSDPVHHVLFKEGISAAWSKIEELHNYNDI